MRRSTVLNGPRRTTAALGMSALLRLAGFLGFAFRGLAPGLLLGAVHALGQFLAAGLAIPLFIGLRRDLAFDQQLGELAPLRLALEWHRGLLSRAFEEDRIEPVDGGAPGLRKAQFL